MVHRTMIDGARLWIVAAFLAAVALILFSPRQVEAIPAFAQTYQVPCTLCHVGFPKLNHFGEEFEHRGFRMPGQEGRFLWEQPSIPLAGRINALAQMQIDRWSPDLPEHGLTDTVKSGLSLFDWQILTGGTLAPRVSFFGQLVGKVQGLGPDDSDTTATPVDHGTSTIRVEVFWAQFNDLLDDGRMNLRIGLDHIDNHFLSTPLRLTHADYLIQFQPGHIGASLHPLAFGVGLNGAFESYGLDYDVGLRNYGPFYNSREGHEARLGAYYGVVSKQISEHTVSFLLAGDKTGDANLHQAGTTLGWGFSLDVHLGKLEFIPGLFWYNDNSRGSATSTGGGTDGHTHDDTTDTGTTTDTTTDPTEHVHDDTTTTGHAHAATGGARIFSGTVGVIYPLRPDLLGTLRYDFNDFDVKEEGITRNARQYVASLAWYLYPNVRWIIEYSRLITKNLEMQGEPGLASLVPTPAESDLTENKAVIRLDVGF